MDIVLNDVEARILGALLEKEVTTPEYYPLSLNALLHACNQKSNRDPYMTLEENAVKQALRSLEAKDLAGPADTSDSRVTKYEHRLGEAFNFNRLESAVFCELLLRGPQTPGELRSRAERMHPFGDLNEVQSTLQRLMNREPPLVKMLPRQTGTKEARYTHLLSGNVETPAFAPSPQPKAPVNVTGTSADVERMARLEDDVIALQREIAQLKQQFSDFRKQFE